MGLHPLERGHSPTQLEFQAGRTENAAQRGGGGGSRGPSQEGYQERDGDNGKSSVPWWRARSVTLKGSTLGILVLHTPAGRMQDTRKCPGHGETEKQDFFGSGKSGKCSMAEHCNTRLPSPKWF